LREEAQSTVEELAVSSHNLKDSCADTAVETSGSAKILTTPRFCAQLLCHEARGGVAKRDGEEVM